MKYAEVRPGQIAEILYPETRRGYAGMADDTRQVGKSRRDVPEDQLTRPAVLRLTDNSDLINPQRRRDGGK
jgi:hypothetical protein